MLEVARFLAEHLPFGGLDPGSVDVLVASTQVEFFAVDEDVLFQDGPRAEFLYLIRRGGVDVVEDGRVVDRLGEGDLFGFQSLLSSMSPASGFRASEETICYLLDGAHAQRLFASPSGLRFLTMALRDRSRSADGLPPSGLDMVGDVTLGPLVVVHADSPVVDLAIALTEAGASAAVVDRRKEPRTAGDDLGIVTDRDIRAKVVAASILEPTVAMIASFPAKTIDSDDPVDTALERMLSLGVHHLPVMKSGQVVGMMTDLDLLGRDRRDAFRLRSVIQRAATVDDVAAAGARIPEVIAPLVRMGVDSRHVGVVVSTLIDGMVVRILQLGEGLLGHAPVVYSWVALGSGGRREQALRTDQDHALVYADGGEGQDGYFLELARFVVDGLMLAGIPQCPSKVMASEDGWRGTESWWRQRMTDWMDAPDSKAAFLTGVAFDARWVAGTLDVAHLFDEAAKRASRAPRFLNRLVRLIVDMDVPVGFLGGLVTTGSGEHRTLDVKLGGLVPVNEMARLFSLEAGGRSMSTWGRLEDAARLGSIETERADALREVHMLLSDLRLEHQTTQYMSGESIDDLIDPATLTPIQRRSLRDAFRVVRNVQRELAERIRPRVMGR